MFEVFELFWCETASWQAHCSELLNTETHWMSAGMNQRHHPCGQARSSLRRPISTDDVSLPNGYPTGRKIHLLLFLAFLAASPVWAQTTNSSAPTLPSSSMIEAAGKVEYSAAGSTNWQPASVGLALVTGDRVRTLA